MRTSAVQSIRKPVVLALWTGLCAPCVMITYRQALDQILDLPLPLRREEVPLLESAGRILSETIMAPWPLPRFDQSAMDGYAVAASDPSISTFRILGESAAGAPFPGELGHGEAIRISTGARLPAGANAILPRELADLTEDGLLQARELPLPGHFIRRRGEDVEEGAPLFGPGTRIDAATLAFLAMFNLRTLPVFARPRVAILGSGNEVRLHGEKLGEADIVGVNLYYLMETLLAFGCEPRIMGVSSDDADELRALLAESIEWGDVVVSTAGVSVGDHDVVGRGLGDLGAEVLFWRVGVRPGKPMMVARKHGKAIFGLPGNPVSTACNTEIFLKPFLRKRLGISPVELPVETMELAEDCPRDAQRLFFATACCTLQRGMWFVRPFGQQSSGNLYNVARANALIVLEAGTRPALRGEKVAVLRVGTGHSG